jgi:hypothetical protein
VSEDPIVGNDQKAETFWSRIAEDYTGLIENSSFKQRSSVALKNRFSGVLTTECLRFQAIFNRVKDAKPSGETDLESVACSVYLKDTGAPFSHIGAWRILSTSPKWANVDI